MARRMWVLSPDGELALGLVCPRCASRALSVVAPPPTTIAPPCKGCHKAPAVYCEACMDKVCNHVRELSAANVASAVAPAREAQPAARPFMTRLWWRKSGKAHLVPADGRVRTLCDRDACTAAWSEAPHSAELCRACAATPAGKSFLEREREATVPSSVVGGHDDETGRGASAPTGSA
jgi:hypothetical protein